MKVLGKVLFLIFVLCFAACGLNDREQQDIEPEQKSYNSGIITFLSGEVTLFKNKTGETLEAVIGDTLYQDDAILTGNDGFCEIQFEDAAILRLEENTHLLLDVVSTRSQEKDIHINMLSGTLMAKVNKMTQQENLSIRTKDTVCGVRGTQFLVSVQEEDTLIAVKEGRVAVLPQAIAVDSGMIKESPKLQFLAEKVNEKAPVLKNDQQIRIKNSDFKDAEGVMALVMTEAENRKTPEEGSFDRLSEFLSSESERVLDMVENPAVVEETVSRKMQIIDTMEFIPEISEPPSQQDNRPSGNTSPEGSLLLLKTDPMDAEVYLNNALLGKGDLSRWVIPGKSYEFQIRREGYQEAVKVYVPEDQREQTLTIRLNQIIEDPQEQIDTKPEIPEAQETKPEPPATARLSIEASPDHTRLTINGEKLNKSSYSGKFKVGEKVTLKAEARGYKTHRETLTVKAGGISRRFTLEELPEEKPSSHTLKVNAVPEDAVIKFNGSRMGKKSVSRAVKSGETVEVTVSRRGYKDFSQNISLSKDQNLDVELIPKPLEKEIDFSQNSIVRRIPFESGYFAAGDASGKIAVFSMEGKKLWEYQSSNSITENSAPVLKQGRLYLSGDKEFVIMSLAKGTVIKSIPLSSQNSHIFGKEVVPSEYGILFPADKSITLLDTETQEVIRTFNIDKELRMTPAVYKDRLFVIDSAGTYHNWNITTGEKIAEFKTLAHFPVAMAPVIAGDRAYISGRKGTLICMDLKSNSIIWEKNLNTPSLLFTDMQLGKGLLFAFSGNIIYAVNSETGALIYTLDKVSSPPLLKKGRIYFGTTDQKLIIAEASSGKELKKLDVKSIITARPTYELGVLLLGTRNGKILFVIPEAIK